MYLELKALSKSYQRKEAVKNISFGVKKGSLLSLLGPSGCGKTTILKAIGGFISIDSGSILLDGIDITHEQPENRPVSTVFQSYGLFPHMNVLANIMYGLKFQGIPKKERLLLGMEMLERMRLTGYEKKRIAELSGGEQQRVALARSLIIKPKLLLLDEPLSNLDAKLRISMREEIKRVQKEFQITTVFVTHDQSEAFELADSIILMDKGCIMQEGNAQDLYNTPKNSFVREFIGLSNKIDTLYIRPERIAVSKFRSQGSDAAAEITEVIFKGEIIELQLQLTQVFLETVNHTLNSTAYVSKEPYSATPLCKGMRLKSIILNDGTFYQSGETVYIRLKA